VGLKKEEVGEIDFVLSSLGPQPNHSAKQININFPPSRNLPAFFDSTMDQFVLFGDSITQHSFSQQNGFAFGAELSGQYARKLDVIK